MRGLKKKHIIKGMRYIAGLLIILLAVLYSSTPVYAFSVTTTSTTAYFDWYSSSEKTWKDQKTPAHTTSSGEIAYCLAEQKTSPSGNAYNTTNILDTYSDRVRNGLQIILETGYPLGGTGGLSAAQARYATANAIRFWLRENGDPNFYSYEDYGGYSDAQLRSMTASGTYGQIGSKMRASSSANKPVLQYSIELLIAARSQAHVYHAISFSALSMSFNGSYFVGSTTVTLANIKYGYTINTSGLPAGSSVAGYTGSNGDTLTIYIPANYDTSAGAFSLSASGYDDRSSVNMIAIKPSNSSYQSVAYATDGESYKVEAAAGALAIYTPGIPDLVITSLTTDKAWYNAGETVTITANVQNQGKGWIDWNYTQLMGIQDQVNNAKNPWDSQQFVYQITAPTNTTATTQSVTVTADVYNYRTELRKDNNSATVSYNVNAGLPDLTVTSLTTDKSLYNPGDTVIVTATVYNGGYTAANNFVTRLSGSSITSQDKTISLAAGASTNVSYSFKAPSGISSMTVTATADATGIIAESNENNNSRSITVLLNQPPTVTLSTSRTRPNINQSFSVTAVPTDPEGSNLSTTITAQYMGMDNASPGASSTLYSGSGASGATITLTGQSLDTRGYYKLTANTVDNYGLTGTKSITIYVNGPPTVNVKCTPEVVPDTLAEADITVTPSDLDGDSLGLVVTIQPLGMDKTTPGEITTIYDGTRNSGQAAVIHQTGLVPGYYEIAATATDPGNLKGSKTLVFLVEITNKPPTVSLTSDKSSYVEGDTAVFRALVTDPNGDELTVVITEQDLGPLGQSPGVKKTVYTGTVVSGSTVKYTRPGMIPHPLRITATVTDPGGLTDTKTLTVSTVPRPIQGMVNHTDAWETNRNTYNAWALRKNYKDKIRPPELFFRGERFVLNAQTSEYLDSVYVRVQILEHPKYITDLTTTDGHNWTGYLWGAEMFKWPAQSLTFVFQNQYIDGTVTQDVVVVRIDREEYYKLRMLY